MAEPGTSGLVAGRCHQCGATGREASGTFCGWCGASLRPVATDGAPALGDAALAGSATAPIMSSPPVRGRVPGRRGVLLASAAVVLVSAWVARGSGPQTMQDDAPHLPTASIADARSAGPVALSPAPACVPPGCDLWSVEVGDNAVAAAGDLFLVIDGGHVEAYSMGDGAGRWSATMARNDPTRRFNVRSISVDQELVLLQAVTSGRLQAIMATSGAVVWSRDLPEVFVVATLRRGDQLVVAGPTTEAAGGLHERVQALDLATGQTRWHRDVAEVIDLDGPTLVVKTSASDVAGLDPGSGEPLWEVIGDGSTRVSTSDTTVAVSSRQGTDLVDRASGELVGAADWGWSDDDHPFLHGNALVVARSSRSGLPDSALLQVLDRSGRPLHDLVTGRWASVAVAGDVVVGSIQRGGQLLLWGVGLDARVLWQRAIDLPSDGCCWLVRPAGDDASVVVTPRAVPGGHVVRLGGDGTTLQEYDVPLPGFSTHDVEWYGLITVLVQDDNGGALLAGPDGGVFLSGRPQVLSSRDPLVVRVGSTVLALDEARVSADQVR